ncbi:uncharacterized protein LOC110455485 [Mizuhopecten yessoensis]|uniref:Uncharacterized protein n=1 Tax=Mizuhopecten yessoensis TaxID=6573 RepID=A0A210QD65_MIZYE|nr:uncharacterized protein LOC110455485 [Mizuhopecten yessoensis]OWF46631.1 hypothetical protein KP79_PYT12270 [Mizuhopecten yessoensis]
MKLTWVLLVVSAFLVTVSADKGYDKCPYGWYIHVHYYYVDKINYVTEQQMTGDYVRFRMIADIGAYQYKFVRDQLWALDDIEPPAEDPIVLRSTCKTETELIYGFWDSSASFCYIVLPGLQNIRRAKCDQKSCCGTSTICHEDGHARQRYWVYCAHFTSPFNGYFAVRYDTFPQCCTCRRCDKCGMIH